MTRLAALLLALAACARPPIVDPAGMRPGEVLYVAESGGLVPRQSAVRPAAWTLYGDGRVFLPAPSTAVHPPPALPALTVLRLRYGAVERIAAAAEAAGLAAPDADLGEPPVTDTPTTVFRYTRRDETVVVRRVYALDVPADGLTAEQRAARQRLAELRAHLTDLNGWLGAGTVVGEERYVPEEVAAYAVPYAPPRGAPAPAAVAWRGPELAVAAETAYGRCTVLVGGVLAAVRADLARATAATRWHTARGDWSIAFRPLLPHEVGCVPPD
ncbi:MAG TPA: hypothetical protein VFQ85_14885 [Mycobacteriales bacterium]|jgi:hypothetical protein|nr:hypothetical protein [Mycobacteriales bacterium]